MSVFNTLQSIIDFEGKSFLDMYAGSGIMGLEALSRGFSEAVAIEKNLKIASIIKNNFKKFEHSPELHIGDSLKIAPKLESTFDVIYIDPPYFAGIYENSLEAIKEIASNIIIMEHINEMDFNNYNLLKQKKYGDKFVTFLTVI